MKTQYFISGSFVIHKRFGYNLWKGGERFEEIASPAFNKKIKDSLKEHEIQEMLNEYMPEDTDLAKWECVNYRIVEVTPKLFRKISSIIKYNLQIGNSLADALTQYPDESAFYWVYRNMEEYQNV